MTSDTEPTTGPPTGPPADPSIERVILVDESDREIGQAEKLSVHHGEGQLHRAFSVMIYNSQGHLMLQKRAVGKYHFGGLWTNTCCGHPRPGETVEAAGQRRLNEEMGIDVELHEVGVFAYEADDERTGLREREIDHVLAGRFDGQPTLNPDEAEGWLWSEPESLNAELAKHPERFTPWFESAWMVAQKSSA
ncbi:MAG: isopentenyl-diphosphate delta-isomerase [Phycisphaerales bacterium]|jgi:isopentenyl-diphosphate delta-isomerase